MAGSDRHGVSKNTRYRVGSWVRYVPEITMNSSPKSTAIIPAPTMVMTSGEGGRRGGCLMTSPD